MPPTPAAEIERLQRQINDLKARLRQARRAAAPEPTPDHELRRPDGTPVRLSALFGEKDDLFVVHNMGRGCAYCTLWADGFTGLAPHLQDRAAFVLCSNDAPEIAGAFAAERGWNFPVVSGAGSDFAREMGFASAEGKPWPGVSAFRRLKDRSIVRTGSAPFGPGDDFCPLWPLFDLLEGGAGDWAPRYSSTRERPISPA
jgi:predicted dithiol-disulfide oxidoreductase (DUF899 family)